MQLTIIILVGACFYVHVVPGTIMITFQSVNITT